MPAKPLTILLVMLAGWINRQQQEAIEYLKEENRILREKLGSTRILLDDSQRRRLAVCGKRIGRKVLTDVCCAFSPDTILKWHRKLVAMKYDGSRNRSKYGRPQISDELRNLIIRIARANRDWGTIRIQGHLKYLGYCEGRSESVPPRGKIVVAGVMTSRRISTGSGWTLLRNLDRARPSLLLNSK